MIILLKVFSEPTLKPGFLNTYTQYYEFYTDQCQFCTFNFVLLFPFILYTKMKFTITDMNLLYGPAMVKQYLWLTRSSEFLTHVLSDVLSSKFAWDTQNCLYQAHATLAQIICHVFVSTPVNWLSRIIDSMSNYLFFNSLISLLTMIFRNKMEMFYCKFTCGFRR